MSQEDLIERVRAGLDAYNQRQGYPVDRSHYVASHVSSNWRASVAEVIDILDDMLRNSAEEDNGDLVLDERLQIAPGFDIDAELELITYGDDCDPHYLYLTRHEAAMVLDHLNCALGYPYESR